MTDIVWVSLGTGMFFAVLSACAAFGAVKFALGSLESVAEGKTEHMGRINATLESYLRIQTEHGNRLSRLEYQRERDNS